MLIASKRCEVDFLTSCSSFSGWLSPHRLFYRCHNCHQALGIPIKIVPGLCTCAAAIKREGLVTKGGRLRLKRSGLPLRTMQEVGPSLYHDTILPASLISFAANLQTCTINNWVYS